MICQGLSFIWWKLALQLTCDTDTQSYWNTHLRGKTQYAALTWQNKHIYFNHKQCWSIAGEIWPWIMDFICTVISRSACRAAPFFCWPFPRIKVVLALFFFAVGLEALDVQGTQIRSKTCLACIAGNTAHQKNVDWLIPHRQVCKDKSFSFKFSSWAFQIFHLQAFFAVKTKTRMVWVLF